ncbi:MAG: hypothetical protein J6032_08895 [Bacteroidales bacterium]|nr:hypothetical protein [Bacteroidales bacterium]
MNRLGHIFDVIGNNGFTDVSVQAIDNYIKDILNGTEDFPRFNLQEHAGLCSAGAPLIGASIVASYATASLTASCHASEGKASIPSNWRIDNPKDPFALTVLSNS